MEIIKFIQEWSSVVAAVFSVGVIVVLVSVTNARISLNQERLELAKEQNEKLKNDLHKVGASLGLEEFVEGATSVKVGDTGDHFSGKIAGRDINESIHNIGESISQIKEQISHTQSTISNFAKSAWPVASNGYKMEYIYLRQPDERIEQFKKIVDANINQGWIFHSATSDYAGIDGMILLFRKAKAFSA